MNKRTRQLNQIMTQRGLSDADVARILGRAETTVRIWRLTTENSRVIPAPLLALLDYETAKNAA